jgi:hypothetical protein
MEREGLVEAARTEKVGNRPERTVYAITAEGQLELTTLREQAIRPLGSGLDPLGVALLFAADGMNPEELRRTLRARREMLAIAVGQIAADREQLIAKGFLDLLAAAVMRRGIMTTEAEIRWHDELDAALAAAGEGATRGRIAGGPPLSLGEGAFDPTTDSTAPGPGASEAAAEEAGAARAEEPDAAPGDGAGQDAR